MTTRTPYAASNLTIIAPEAPEAGEFRKKFWSALRNATVAQTQVVTNKSRPQEVTLINITNVFPARFVKGRNSDYRRTPCPLCVRFLAGLSRQDHGVSAVEHGGGMEAVTRGVGCPQEPTRTPLSHGGEEETRGRAADAADFYSHTNYIELKKTVIDTRLGRSTFTRGQPELSGPSERTCQAGYWFNDSIGLTSGYFPSNHKAVNQNGKCAHGDYGILEANPVRGINKDAPPMPTGEAAHKFAAYLAFEHTLIFTSWRSSGMPISSPTAWWAR